MLKSLTLIADDFPSKGRPTNIFVEQLVNALTDIGVQVYVIAAQSLTRYLFRHQPPLPKYSKVFTSQGSYYEVFRPYSLSFGNIRLLDTLLLSINKVVTTRIVKRLNAEVLYGHFWHNAIKVNKYAYKKRIPLFVACGEGDDALENIMKRISRKDLLVLKQSITGVISVSSENKRKCIEYGLADAKNITVQPNCVDTDLFYHYSCTQYKERLGIQPGDFTIIFVGSFIPRKGPDRVAEALRLLNDEHIKVIFIGKPFSGYDYDFDCGGIIYKGPVEHSDLPNYLNCADLFLRPTQKEGCCNAIVEALSCGLPIVSSLGEFNDDILDDENSIRVDPMNVKDIAEAIAFLRDHPEIRKKMINKSLSRHNQYSIKGRAIRIKAFIEGAL